MLPQIFFITPHAGTPLKACISEPYQTLSLTEPKPMTCRSLTLPHDDRTDDSGMDTGSGSARLEEWRRGFTKPPPGKTSLLLQNVLFCDSKFFSMPIKNQVVDISIKKYWRKILVLNNNKSILAIFSLFSLSLLYFKTRQVNI